MIRGVRGAIQAEANSVAAILQASQELMEAMIRENGIHPDQVSAVFFTVTPDLDAAFPATVRERIGWNLVPFFCGQEIPVRDAMHKMVRVLILFETEKAQDQIRHQYLGAASRLRPDLGN